MALEDIRNTRLAKLKQLRAVGIDPYPATTSRTHTIEEALASFDSLAASGKAVVVAGRVRAVRGHGGSTFVDLEDGSGNIQVYMKKDILGDTNYQLFIDTVDIGDFIEATGTLFLTKKEEKTVETAGWGILTKTLLPLPEKWHGLQDVEERYRRRYLDLIMNPEVRARFAVRSRLTAIVRGFFADAGFLEVE